mmetsp:Transcript_6940/g.11387  ORF Transcript_6940/g.11387 Transcript_6940/m.11387 type:complete len:100 (+) Transcript_6940:3-302(+)
MNKSGDDASIVGVDIRQNEISTENRFTSQVHGTYSHSSLERLPSDEFTQTTTQSTSQDTAPNVKKPKIATFATAQAEEDDLEMPSIVDQGPDEIDDTET